MVPLIPLRPPNSTVKLVLPMTRLERAMERFSASLDTLEQALAARQREGKALAEAQREIQGLKRDRERLQDEVERMKGEAEALESLTEEVSQRLDGAIREVRSILDVRPRSEAVTANPQASAAE